MIFTLDAQLPSYLEAAQAEQDAHYVQFGKYKVIAAVNGNPNVFCHEYHGNLGAGWILYVKENGFTKAIDMGNESRSFDWMEIGG